MRTSLAAAVVSGVVAGVSTAQADGLILKLPADETWAVYKAEGYKTRGDKTKEHVNGWFRISSVGKKTDSGEPCRWIAKKCCRRAGGVSLRFEVANRDPSAPHSKRTRAAASPGG